MMTSISSSMGSAMMMRSSGAQQQPPPGKDAFKVADSDGDGLVTSSELTSVLDGIAETTGTTLDIDKTLETYDLNQDGGLSGEEMFALMKDNDLGPPLGMEGEGAGPPPPPPPSTEQAIASYEQNSGESLLSQLIDYLDSSGDDSENSNSISSTS